MRLHLNENTAGCSPAVLEVLRRLERTDAGFYPDYDAVTRAVGGCFGVPPEYVLVTNGLDEGILAASIAAFRERSADRPEMVSVVPAFDMYEIYADALGGRFVAVPMPPDFTLPVGAIKAAAGPAARIVFLANPHNPSGVMTPPAVLRDLARDIAPVLLFADEAYADFAGETLIDRATLDATPNLLVGRTFSKAYGLAGLRAGAVVATPATLDRLRKAVPPYSLNAWAAAALPAAIEDRAYRDAYVAEAAQSRMLLAEACTRLGLTTWPSVANFRLVRIGPRVQEVLAGLSARGIRVRDRSREHGCAECVRITAGRLDDTRRVIGALEEILCGGRR
jgi:histidinol-phosphate aminotransferase